MAISKNEKELIFVSLFEKKGELTIKKLSTIFKCDPNDIDGYRISADKKGKKNKPIFTEVKSIKNALNFLKIPPKDFVKSVWQKNFNYIDKINELIHLKSSFKNPEKLYAEFIKTFSDLNINYDFKTGLELYLNENFSKIKSPNKYSAYSQKALNEIFIPKLLDDELGNNSECIRHEFKKYRSKIIHINSKTLDINSLKINENIFSPTVVRSVRQTFKVINAILKSKKYCNFIFDNISLEMCRDKNTKEEKDRIYNNQSLNKKQNKEIQEFTNNLEISNTIRLKIFLAKSQDWFDPYNLEKIEKPPRLSSKDDLIKWSGKYEIDHIIPFKYFHDDSRSNKVLTSRENNFEKRKRTPYEWLGSKPNWNHLVAKFKPKKFINNEWILDKDKIKNFQLTDVGVDISTQMNPRKLVDTRYTIKFVYDSLRNFFNDNSFYGNKNKPKIFTVNGAVTSYFRNKFCYDKKYNFKEFKKDRDNFKHHAIDAIIVALFSVLPPEFVSLFRKLSSLQQQKLDLTVEQREIKDIYKSILDKKLVLDEQFDHLKIKKIVEWIKHNKPKFSYMLETHNNITFFNETNYSYHLDINKNVVTKEKIFIFDDKKIKDIFYLFDDQVKRKQSFTNAKCLLNIDTIEYLKRIYIDGKIQNKDNPFRAYMEKEYGDKNPCYLKFDLNGIENKIRNISFAFSTNEGIDNYFENKKIGCINTSFKSIAIDCYFRDDKWFVIPLNVKTYDFNKKKKSDGYFTMLQKMNLNPNNFKFKLKKGQTFVNSNGDIFRYVSYSWSGETIEIKPIDYRLTENKRLIYKINSFFANFKICDFDILGNKYERKIYNNKC